MKTELNPTSLPPKALRQWEAIYKSAQARGATGSSAAAQAWSTVKRKYKKSGKRWVLRKVPLKAAKRASKTKRNPLIPRMEYVAKTYGPWVTMATIGAWAEATGRHSLRESLAHMWNSTILIDELREFVGQRPGEPMDTRFDRYLPWVAREFNRMLKPLTRGQEGNTRLLDDVTGMFDMDAMRAAYHHGFTTQEREIAEVLSEESLALRNRFRSIVDWAEAEKVDLNKYQWPQALSEAAAWGASQPAAGVAQGKVVYTFGDGWTVQELKTAEQLGLEGEAMQHCVGSYEGKVGSGRVRIFSLRDTKGHPHATMEWNVDEEYVPQLKGKQNDEPKDEYLGKMVRFRLDYLPSNLARPLPDFKPGILEDFVEDYLGAWAIRQPRKKGVSREQTVLIYDTEVGWVTYDLDTLNEFVDDALEKLDRDCDDDYLERYEGEDDEEYELRNDAFRGNCLRDALKQWAQDTSLTGRGRRHPALQGEYGTSALDWSVWQDTGNFPAGKQDDEMIEQIQTGFDNSLIPASQKSSAAANPRGRGRKSSLRGKLKPAESPMASLKRKLMR